MTEKELKASVAKPCGGYFFYGDEDYLKDYYMGLIRKAVIADEELAAFNEYFFDNESFTAAALEEAVAAPPMMAEQKLIRVRLTSYSSLPERERKALAEVYARLGEYPDTVLVICVAPDGFDGGTERKPSAALKSLEKHLNCVSFPLSQEPKLMRWLARRFAGDGLGADEAALRMMISLCGRSMHRLAGEAAKLSARALSMGLTGIGCRLVAETVTVTPEEDAFMLANSVLEGNTEAALDCLGRARRRNEPPLKLLAAASAEFSNLAAVAQLAEEGADKRMIVEVTGLHEYRAGRYLRMCQGVDVEILREIVSMCAEADLKLKSSSLGYVPLERLICAAGDLRRRG